MAYLKKGLLGPHTAMDRGLVGLKRRTMERRFPRDNFSGLPAGWKNDMHQLPNYLPPKGGLGHTFPGFSYGDGHHMDGPDHILGGGPYAPHQTQQPGFQGPQRESGGGPQLPHKGGGMGWQNDAPAWQTQQPGFYDEQMGSGPGPDGGPMQEAQAQHPNLPPGFMQGKQMPPNLMELIKQLLGQGGGGFGAQRAPWEGQMNPNFGRPQNFGVS